MSAFRGRPRHGPGRKQSKTVSLSAETIERLETLGNGNLSAGIAIAEHATRGLQLAGYSVPRLVDSVRKHGNPNWLVFELVDGPADPPPRGENIDAWRDQV